MNTIETAYINALLADASYVTQIAKGDIAAERLKTRLTQTQANFLAANFKVIDSVETHNPNKPGDPPGFDAVVWEGKSGTPYAGQLYVSMRGTDGKTDISDDIDLVATGIPNNQIRDMVNWWMRISTPIGQSAAQVQYIPVKVGVDKNGKDVYENQFTAAASVNGEGLVNNRIISGVNGHSLGGYLATAFTRLFGGRVLSVSTFNSAGFSNVSTENIRKSYDQISQLVGTHLGTGSLDAVASRQTNFYADNGWEFTTNAWGEKGFLVPGFNQYGSRTALFQEKGTGTANHSMYKLTDLLALGNALSQLDSNLSIEELNALSMAGSNRMAASYEGILDGVRRLLLGPNTAATPASDSAEGANRSTYHANLKALTDSRVFKALAQSGTVTLSVASAALASSAKADFGAFLSLNALSPIVLSTGSDAAATAALQAAHPSLYTAWHADNSARLYGETTRQPAHSDHWYSDRAAMLTQLVARNQQDRTGIVPVTGSALGTRYFDTASNTEVLMGAGSAARMMVLFGASRADALDGGGFADRLYGGAGHDTLDGKGGADHLEGGTGTDTYRFSSSFGKDTVVDADGLGTIEIDGQTLGTAKGSGQLNTWVAELGAGTGQWLNLTVHDDNRSSTGKRLVIAAEGDSARKMRTSAMNDTTWTAAA